MKQLLLTSAALVCLLCMSAAAWGQSPVPMASTGTYTEDFSTVSTWTNGFASPTEATRFGGVAVNATGTIPDGKRVTTATTTFTTGTSGGVQKGTGALVLLSTGTTDNTSSAAVDLFLDFTGVNAGTLSFDWASVNNSTGDRKGSMRVYTSMDGTTFTELTGAAVLNFTNNSLTSGSVVNVTLPASFNNSATARIRFYYYNGTGGTTGSRPKLSLDNLKVTSASAGPAVEPTVQASNVTFSNVGSNSLTVGWTNGNGASRLVLAKQGSPVDAAPADGTAYTANNAFGSGTQIGAGNFVVFAGAGSSVNVTNLSPSTTYYFAVFEFNGSGSSTNYLVTSPATGSQTTAAAYAISGTVRNRAGAPMNGVSLTLSSGDTPLANTTTNASGNYSFPTVTAGGDYQVTPSAAGFTFSPASRSFDALGANQTADFTALASVIISEFRTQGTTTGDEFIELYNSSEQAINLSGFTLGFELSEAASTSGSVVLSGTIPAHGHFLLATAGYTLGAAAADQTISSLALTSGITLVSSSGPALDAAGFNTSSTFYKEGAGLTPASGFGQYSFVRKLASGSPQDTDDNAADFVFISTDGGTYGGVSVLGAPGPENTGSPLVRSSATEILSRLIDPAMSSTVSPNRVRDTSDTGTNKTLGTLIIRRTWVNNTGLNVTRLRFRIVDVTTLHSPNAFGGAAQSDLRALTSSDVTVTRTDGSTIPVQGTTVEEPPTQTLGGGLNSTFTVALGSPIPQGSAVSTQFVLGVMQSGKFNFFVNVEAVTQAPPSSSEHLVMGNPSNATADVNQPTNYLMVKNDYALAYHRDRGTPIWTSWHLDSSWLGSAPRQNDFRNDTTLPAGWYQVLGTDYSGSGFDRGHMTPSGDRTSSVPVNSETFLMTNMIPQAPDNNQGPWEQLESYCRTLVSQGNEVYIISGGSGIGGTGSNGGTTSTIAGGHVTVPSQTWKVIIVLPQGAGDDAARVTTSTRTIAVIMPNTQGIRTNTWQQYRVSVDQVEALTGFDFFSNVPTNIQAVIEASVDNQ
ncbi:MAG: DNA/RNA non-specific endonuclease [Pyrinomonadaceae bacterium]